MGRLPTSLASRFRTVPAWYADAKLGIFIHWVPASVPGFAPTGADIRELLSSDMTNPISELPYSEWYENSLRFPNSSVAKHHARTYGNRPYAGFAQDFEQGLDVLHRLLRLGPDPARHEFHAARSDADLAREIQHVADANRLRERQVRRQHLAGVQELDCRCGLGEACSD